MYLELGNLRRQSMALYNLAQIHNEIGQKDKALNTYFEILKIEKELGEKGEQVTTYYAIADLYYSRNDYKNAKNYCTIGIDLADDVGAKAELAVFYDLLAQVYKAEYN